VADFDRLRRLVGELTSLPTPQLSKEAARRINGQTRELTKVGVPKPLADRISRLNHGVDTLYFIEGTAVNPAPKQVQKNPVYGVYVWDALDSAFGFRDLEGKLLSRSSEDKWEAIALLGLSNLFSEVHCALANKALGLQAEETAKDCRKAVSKLVKSRNDLSYLSRFLKEASEESPSVPKLLVLGDRLKTAARQLVIG
jgi:NAD-specific glutamate dehydrogenase